MAEVKKGHIRQYLSYVQARGKYTVVSRERTAQINFPQNVVGVSTVTINNYICNIKVFFNWLKGDGELQKNPVDNIKQIKTIRRQKRGIQVER
ncbi:hypothetical protein DQX05_11565 [Paenibacillus thiaminolyticus]|uniref:Core-binding (CB) domain-containing protein n=1 Tax=Paenibacillus thiaminolyticus TaxID=49283 RepID=A0A3A3GMF8_PANTH|nr:hypothetical protein DQX05_11565 [Paenibacillus thiaminolyticus]